MIYSRTLPIDMIRGINRLPMTAFMVWSMVIGEKRQTRRVGHLLRGRLAIISETLRCAPWGDHFVATYDDLCWKDEPGQRDIVEVWDDDLEEWQVVKWRWKNLVLPSRFCPSACCRYVVEIIGQRQERLQAISDADARLEGFTNRQSFATYWKTIHGSGGDHSWQANPVVNVITFDPIPTGAICAAPIPTGAIYADDIPF